MDSERLLIGVTYGAGISFSSQTVHCVEALPCASPVYTCISLTWSEVISTLNMYENSVWVHTASEFSHTCPINISICCCGRGTNASGFEDFQWTTSLALPKRRLSQYLQGSGRC